MKNSNTSRCEIQSLPKNSVDEKFDHQLMKNSNTSRCEIQSLPKNEELSLHSDAKIQSLVDEKTITKQDINKNNINNHNHNHDCDCEEGEIFFEDDKKLKRNFEKIFAKFNVQYSPKNQEAVKSLLNEMSVVEVEDYLEDLYEDVCNTPGVRSIEALFSYKLQKGEYQINPSRTSTPFISSYEEEKASICREPKLQELTEILERQSKETLEKWFEEVKELYLQRERPEVAKVLLKGIDTNYTFKSSVSGLRKEWLHILKKYEVIEKKTPS